MFCIYLRTNSDLCHLQHKLIGFYNLDEKCLLRGTDWVFKYAQAIIRRPLTAEAQVRSQVSPCAIYGGRSGTETGFSPSSYVFPVSGIPPPFHTHLHLHAALIRRENRRSLETFEKRTLSRKSGSTG